MTAPVLLPHSELVMRAWLLGVPGVPASGAASDLPRDQAAWTENGFVTFDGPIGGGMNMDVPMRSPVFQVDCWAVAPGSGKPPWGKANQLAEFVVADTQRLTTNPAAGRRAVALPGNYLGAMVHAVVVQTEPRRIRSDDGSYARYQMDVQLWWTAAA